jgi:hypothetical protein
MTGDSQPMGGSFSGTFEEPITFGRRNWRGRRGGFAFVFGDAFGIGFISTFDRGPRTRSRMIWLTLPAPPYDVHRP